MTYDGRFLCPTCGRSALPPDYRLAYPMATPAMLAGMEGSYLQILDLWGGKLLPGSDQACISGHTWVVPDAPADAPAAASEVGP